MLFGKLLLWEYLTLCRPSLISKWPPKYSTFPYFDINYMNKLGFFSIFPCRLVRFCCENIKRFVDHLWFQNDCHKKIHSRNSTATGCTNMIFVHFVWFLLRFHCGFNLYDICHPWYVAFVKFDVFLHSNPTQS